MTNRSGTLRNEVYQVITLKFSFSFVILYSDVPYKILSQILSDFKPFKL